MIVNKEGAFGTIDAIFVAYVAIIDPFICVVDMKNAKSVVGEELKQGKAIMGCFD